MQLHQLGIRPSKALITKRYFTQTCYCFFPITFKRDLGHLGPSCPRSLPYSWSSKVKRVLHKAGPSLSLWGRNKCPCLRAPAVAKSAYRLQTSVVHLPARAVCTSRCEGTTTKNEEQWITAILVLRISCAELAVCDSTADIVISAMCSSWHLCLPLGSMSAGCQSWSSPSCCHHPPAGLCAPAGSLGCSQGGTWHAGAKPETQVSRSGRWCCPQGPEGTHTGVAVSSASPVPPNPAHGLGPHFNLPGLSAPAPVVLE